MNKVKFNYARPLDLKNGRVDMSHGSGGRAMAQLITELFAAAFNNEYLAQGNDGALLPPANGRLVVATDSHVVSPLFFAGGDIGSLSVHGTINDVAVMGARPLYLAASFILEEGFPLADLKRIVESMANASREAGVPIVTGDTKVVERGKGDGVFITTTGIGVAREFHVRAVARLAGIAMADGVGQHEEKFRRVQRLAGAEKFTGKAVAHELPAAASGAMHDEHGIIDPALGVAMDRAQRAVMHAQLRQASAILKAEIANHEVMLGGLGKAGGERRHRQGEEDEDAQQRDTKHSGSP